MPTKSDGANRGYVGPSGDHEVKMSRRGSASQLLGTERGGARGIG